MVKVESEGIATTGSSTNSEDSGYDNGCQEDSSTSSDSSSCYQQPCVFQGTKTRYHKCSLETYNISGCSIETISARTFLYYANYLKELNLCRNKISSLPETICELKHLKVLNLSHNALTDIPSSWKKMHELRVLNLSHNQLTEAPQCLELGMERLMSIDLSHNNVKCMSAPVCLPFLQELNLSKNLFITLPLWLFSEKCRSLKELDVSSNFCFDDPKLATNIYVSKHFRTSALKNLKKLNISNTGTKPELISCLSHFECLQSLFMGNVDGKESSFNSFWEISMSIFSNPSSVVELYLPKVGLASVPDDFCKLESLRVLDLANNPLNWLPESFGRLKSLQELTLTNCGLSYLPDSFAQLTCVTRLHLDSNQLTDVSSQLAGLTSLQWLDLYDNFLENFPLPLELLTSPQLEGVDVAANFINLNEANTLEASLISIYYQLQANLRNCSPDYESRTDSCKISNHRRFSEGSESWKSVHFSKEDLSSLNEDDIDYSGVAEPYANNEVEEENWDDDSSCNDDDQFEPDMCAVQRYCLYPPGKYKFGWTPPIRHMQECIVPTAQQVSGFVYIPGQVHTRTTRARHKKVELLTVAQGQFDDLPMAAPSEPCRPDTLWDLLNQWHMFLRHPQGPLRAACRICAVYEDCWHHGVWICF